MLGSIVQCVTEIMTSIDPFHNDVPSIDHILEFDLLNSFETTNWT